MPAGVSVQGIRKSYGRRLAVDDVSFVVGPGEIVGFVGPNGAGKSTTLRILTGLLRPDAGHVSLDDVALSDHPREFRARIGALIEAPAMYPMLTAADHLNYLARLRGRAGGPLVRETLRAVNLDPDSRKRVRHFSLGMKQRLGIAMAIFANPSLLVLDEPMNGLDPAGMAELRAFIRALPGRLGASVLVSSHLLAEIEQTCDRVLFLRDGRIIGDAALGANAPAAGVVTLHVRTGDDARAVRIFQQQPFIGEARTEASGGLVCRVAFDDVGLIAPLLVEHGLTLLEMTPHARDLEQEYLAHYANPQGRMLS